MIYFGVLFTFACVIIVTVVREGESKERQQAAREEKQDSQWAESRRVLLEIQHEQLRVRRPGADPSGLRQRAISLAEEIGAFVDRRLEEYMKPGLAFPQEQGDWGLHDRETVRRYWSSFRDRVQVLRDEIARYGYRNDDLNRASAHQPTSNADIFRVINGFRSLSVEIGMAQEKDEALPITPIKQKTIGQAQETDEALPLTRGPSASDSEEPGR